MATYIIKQTACNIKYLYQGVWQEFYEGLNRIDFANELICISAVANNLQRL